MLHVSMLARWSSGAIYVAFAVLGLSAYGILVSEEQLVSPRAARDALRRVGGPPPAIQCYSSHASAGFAETDNTPALVDPRRNLMGNELLICEVPGTGQAGEQRRLFTMLGTPVAGADLVIPPPGHIPTSNAPVHSQTETFPSFDEWKVQQLEDRERRKRRRNTTSAAPASAATTTATALPHVESSPAPIESDSTSDTAPSAPILAVDYAPSALFDLKHRSNYASLDCAAAVHQANPSAKFASAILSGKKDKYMLSPCPAAMCTEAGCTEGQFVVVELCQHVRVDTLVLGNLEFFSSMFKRFEVRLASTLHAAEENWHFLGSFRARNVRGLQVFRIDNVPSSYYRYMRIDFMEHYGSEHYCPVSVLRVYGRNEREDVDDDVEEEEEDPEPALEAPPTPSQSQLELPQVPEQPEPVEIPQTASAVNSPTQSPVKSTIQTGQVPYLPVVLPPRAHRTAPLINLVDCDHADCGDQSPLEAFPGVMPRTSRRVHVEILVDAASAGPNASACADLPMDLRAKIVSGNISASATAARNQSGVHINSGGICTTPPPPMNTTNGPTGSVPPAETTANTTARSPRTNGRGQRASNSTQGGTESIYRSITKRLTALESNTSLSMQYLQLSSQVLREKLVSLERMQETKLGQLLVMLNASNTQQMNELRQRQTDEMQRTRVAFEMQNQRMEMERSALLLKVEHMTRDMRLEKRWSLMQLIFLLALLAFMTMTRSPMATSTAVPHVPMRQEDLAHILGEEGSRSSTPVARNNPMPGGVPCWADPWTDGDASGEKPNAQNQRAELRGSDLHQSVTPVPASPGVRSATADPDDSTSTIVAREDRMRRSHYRPVSSSWRRRSFAASSPTVSRTHIPLGMRSEGRARGIPPPVRAPRPLSAVDSRSDTESVDSAT